MQQILCGGMYQYDNVRAKMANLTTIVIENYNVNVLDRTCRPDRQPGSDREHLVELITRVFPRQSQPKSV